MKMTANRKIQIYEQVISKLKKHKNTFIDDLNIGENITDSIYMCDIIKEIIAQDEELSEPLNLLFPELFIQQPEKPYEILGKNLYGWFPDNDHESRIECLRKAIKMVKDNEQTKRN